MRCKRRLCADLAVINVTDLGVVCFSNGVGQNSVSFLMSQGRFKKKERISSMKVGGNFMSAIRMGDPA